MSATHSGRGPDFMCIGMQKAGTRWLYELLRSHPQFWMPPIKELHFFDRKSSDKEFPTSQMVSKLSWLASERTEDRAFADRIRQLERRSNPDIEVYASLFEPAGSLLTGDITPGYGGLPPHQIEQIAGRFPNLKVLLMLRDPISRLWSNVNDAANKGSIPRGRLLSVEGMRRTIGLPNVSSVSYPARTYCKWAPFFPKERFKTFFLDDVVASPETTRSSILSFFSADPEKRNSNVPASYNSKAGRARAEMSGEVRAFLIATFEKEMQDCARLFGGHADNWLVKYGLSPPHSRGTAIQTAGWRNWLTGIWNHKKTRKQTAGSITIEPTRHRGRTGRARR